MRSVADDLRRELHERVARLSPAERIELSLHLGEEDIRLLSRAQGISVESARRLVARARALGRRPSAANAPNRDDAP